MLLEILVRLKEWGIYVCLDGGYVHVFRSGNNLTAGDFWFSEFLYVLSAPVNKKTGC